MSVAGSSIGEAFVSIAGRDRVRDDFEALAAATVDGLRPRWVVRPASIEQLSRVLALACDGRLGVIPRGAGSSLELGNPPARVDVVLELAELDQVIEYNPDDLTITVQAGISAGALASLTSIRTSIVSGGIACVAGCVVLALAFPALLRYDARNREPAPA